MMANGDKVQASNLLHLLNTMGPYIWLHVACPTDNVKRAVCRQLDYPYCQ